MTDRETKARVFFETIRHLLDPGLVARFTYDGCVVHLGVVRMLVDAAIEELVDPPKPEQWPPEPPFSTKLHIVRDADLDAPRLTLCGVSALTLSETEAFVAQSRWKVFKVNCSKCLSEVARSNTAPPLNRHPFVPSCFVADYCRRCGFWRFIGIHRRRPASISAKVRSAESGTSRAKASGARRRRAKRQASKRPSQMGRTARRRASSRASGGASLIPSPSRSSGRL